jgi:hypothetical protein
MAAEKKVFEIAVNSISAEGQKLTKLDDGSILVSRATGKMEVPMVKLYSVDNGNAIIIENALGKSKPMESVVQIKENLKRMGVVLNKATEVNGPHEVHNKVKELN